RFDWVGLFRYPKIAYLTAPLVMILALGLSLFVVRPGWQGIGGRPRRDGVRPPYGAPAPPALHGPRALPRGPVGLQGVASGAAAGPPVIEEVGSPGARVDRFTVGGAEDETAIYLVVDETIDI
ncbi:MAG TPA: hypothetical protein VFT43_00660, partial [Candidatus Polarisedimenticolia bacterium]|nr:hypothetical protein [Candidatus Polarisedimenticolia bacterium]